ncbi:AMP-dependent synthetase [Serratia marcescens]|uniref:AMP-binding protein n=1 Tax=Serratia marcescens TaxID=615 RepID=UPI000CDE4BFF|nr:AMP-binding protein [Serratia marcescens]POW84952.1 AMP-dependent synthetase [Serratia marcescens]POW89688.1 AMP-dependent synthetase [Serratia marcescens]POX03753.1 AMP-dependent synthetase [Serratia marcescens]POX08596.1 AMP-dependent synthetase [Serratia marcescens]
MTLPLSLSQWLSASRSDETPIAWLGEQTWTLGQLRYDVSILLDRLRQQEAERWALCFENSYLLIVALLAVLYAGKTPVIPGHRRVSLLEEQRSLFSGVLSDAELCWSGALLVVESAQKPEPTKISLPAITDDASIELFTSGSTGQPKRVVKRVAVLDYEARLLATRFSGQLDGCRVVASVAPLHLYGLTFSIFLPMSQGLPLHAAMVHYVEQLAAFDRSYRYLFVSSPAFLKRLDPRLAAPSVSMIFSAGGMLPWKDVMATQAWLGVWPDEIYGSTETGILAWRYREQDDIPWQLFPGVRITAKGDAFCAVSPLIAQPDGQLLDDELQFIQHGRFRLQGRRGRVVKIEEKRISLSEVERRLIALDGIRDAAALPIFRRGRQGIGALLVLDRERQDAWREKHGNALELSWRRALLQWLEPVAIPRYWRVVDEIPVNSMNKRVDTQLQEFFNDAP